ncbi:unnamed protein product [Coregonus sp. 'balchen']|nr:unnamed protein product [Coregonus sp. 'balchen']
MGGDSFAVPNFISHSSVEDIRAVLGMFFFCLLLVPRCGEGPPGLPPPRPCHSFCEVLRDSCWTVLDDGRLPRGVPLSSR